MDQCRFQALLPRELDSAGVLSDRWLKDPHTSPPGGTGEGTPSELNPSNEGFLVWGLILHEIHSGISGLPQIPKIV